MMPEDGITSLERMMMAQASKKHIPVNGSLELLPLCNMNCDMCYVRLSREEMHRQGRLRTADEWLEIGRQMQKAGVLFLLLTGGEPLLYPDFRRLYLGLKRMGMILTINTNGTLIDEEWAAFFEANRPRRINITLYGADEKAYTELCHFPGGFEKTLRGIRLLREHGVDVKISGSLTKANQEDVRRLIAIGDALQVPVRIDTYMMPAVRERKKPYAMQTRLDPEKAAAARIEALKYEMGPDLFSKYAQKTIWEVAHILPDDSGENHMSCHAGNCSFTVNWQGEMRPCVILNEPAVSVFDAGFEEAWHYIVEETDKILLCMECNSCSLRPLCRTCAACALLEEGAYDRKPEYMCRYTEESFRLLKAEADREVSNE